MHAWNEICCTEGGASDNSPSGAVHTWARATGAGLTGADGGGYAGGLMWMWCRCGGCWKAHADTLHGRGACRAGMKSGHLAVAGGHSGASLHGGAASGPWGGTAPKTPVSAGDDVHSRPLLGTATATATATTAPAAAHRLPAPLLRRRRQCPVPWPQGPYTTTTTTTTAMTRLPAPLQACDGAAQRRLKDLEAAAQGEALKLKRIRQAQEALTGLPATGEDARGCSS